MVAPPTVGLFAVNIHSCAEPHGAAVVAELAEGLGYDSLWVGDHVVLPRPRGDVSPLDADAPLLDPLVALAHLAARTQRVRLGTGCVVLPQRNPLVLAKQLASVDVLSGGRLIAGVAAGYLEPELRAVGVPLDERGARTVEYLQAMRALWHDEAPSYQGRFVSFDGVDAYPRPAQQPLPVVMGGHSRAAHRRAVDHADGWYGFMLGLRATADQVASLRGLAERTGRATPLHVSVSPARAMSPGNAAAYANLGVDRLIVVPPPGLSLADLTRFVTDNAPHQLGLTAAP